MTRRGRSSPLQLAPTSTNKFVSTNIIVSWLEQPSDSVRHVYNFHIIYVCKLYNHWNHPCLLCWIHQIKPISSTEKAIFHCWICSDGEKRVHNAKQEPSWDRVKQTCRHKRSVSPTVCAQQRRVMPACSNIYSQSWHVYLLQLAV